MPWQECSKVDERLKFVARLLEGEKMAVLCREFDISRQTGYKIFARCKDCGLEGLTDRSRRPYRQGCLLLFRSENLILQLKREHPSWGAPKIRQKIRRRHSEIQLPAISTVHGMLDRHGMVNFKLSGFCRDDFSVLPHVNGRPVHAGNFSSVLGGAT
jgi:putative transposase